MSREVSSYPVSTATGPDVRVRFCPSPTGTPHVGLIRTALFNWAYARHNRGTFIVRIEDTDAARDSDESYAQLVDALRWLHLDWDEGVEVGGPDAPYRQSQRSDIYRDVVGTLVASGHVYESFSTADEIESRNRARGLDPKRGYDNFDRDLTDSQRSAFRALGRVPALRLRVPDEERSFDDLVRGPITFPSGSSSDFVVVRPSGDPLYTLVNPVDDALMRVTHVLRGDDLLSSTPRQIALYHALIDVGIAEWVPRFGHLPTVLGAGNTKLSKRQPESNVFVHRDRGFIPEGLVNYLALLGWSLTHDRDVFSVDELVSAFDVVDVNPNPARFDLTKAESINGDHIRNLDVMDFAQRTIPYLVANGIVADPPTRAERSTIFELAPLVQERIALLGEVPELVAPFFSDDDEFEFRADALAGLNERAGEVATAAIASLDAIGIEEWTHDQIRSALEASLVHERGLKPRVAFGVVRVAVSGRRISPPLFESLQVLGKRSTIARLTRFSEHISS